MFVETTYTYDFPSNAEKTVFAWSRLVGRFSSQMSVLFLMALALTWSVKDPLNRLTNESISNAVSGPNGATSYGYDSINRLSWSSNLPNVPNVSPTYDPDDRRTSDENFDSNGSTINTGGHSYTYDAEGKLTGVDNGAITLAYDGDGNLISKVNSTTGKTETFLIDTANPTGYAQIVETQVNGSLANVFNYGPNGIISQGNVASVKTVYFGKDGSNSTRFLTDSSGNATDTFDYSPDGILVNRTGTTPTYNLFQGEHYVPEMGLYWLRARWMNPQVGEFMTMDDFEGDQTDPASLHKYAFTQWDGGVNGSDPSGNETIFDAMMFAWIALAKHADASVLAEAGLHPGRASMKQMPDDLETAQLAAAIYSESGNSSLDEGYAIGATVINRLYYNRIRFSKLPNTRSLYRANDILGVVSAAKGEMFQGYGQPKWSKLMETDTKVREFVQIQDSISISADILEYNSAIDSAEALELAQPYGDATVNVSALGYRNPISFNRSGDPGHIAGYGDQVRFPAEFLPPVLGKHHFAGYKIGSEPNDHFSK